MHKISYDRFWLPRTVVIVLKCHWAGYWRNPQTVELRVLKDGDGRFTGRIIRSW
jgi:hypothetical protein